jgi:hypothetical protein
VPAHVGVHHDSELGRDAGALDHAVESLSTRVARRTLRRRRIETASSFPSTI